MNHSDPEKRHEQAGRQPNGFGTNRLQEEELSITFVDETRVNYMTKALEIISDFLKTDYVSGERRLGRAADLTLRYGTAAIFVGLAFWIRWALTPLIGFGSPFMVLAPAALLAARFGGLGPGLAATAAGIALGDYYFTPPVHSWGPYGPAQITLIITYGIATTVGVLLFDRVQKSKRLVQAAARRAEAAAEQAELRGKELEAEIGQRERVEAQLRNARDELARHAEQLESRVQERTAHLHQALSSLESVLYHIAHDLRGPLRIMHAFSRMLAEDYARRLDDAGRDYAKRISAAACRMDQMLHSLVEYGQVCHLEVIPTRVSTEHVLKAVLGQFSGRTATSGATIEIRRPLMDVWADSRLLQMVLTKLLSNALKFVPSDRKPHIRIWTESAPVTGEAADAARVRLHVRDNGVGIAPEYHERVFGLFQRLRQEEADESRGIGLPIVQAAIERMDGVVGVTSAPGHGSTFWLELAGIPPEARSKDSWASPETRTDQKRLSRGHMRLTAQRIDA